MVADLCMFVPVFVCVCMRVCVCICVCVCVCVCVGHYNEVIKFTHDFFHFDLECFFLVVERPLELLTFDGMNSELGFEKNISWHRMDLMDLLDSLIVLLSSL